MKRNEMTISAGADSFNSFATRVCISPLIAALFVLSALAAAQNGASARVGTINIEQAIFASNEGQRDFADLSKKLEPKQAELKNMNEEMESLKKQLATQANGTDSRNSLAKEIERKQKSLDRAVQDARDDAQTQQNAIAQRILQKMAPVIVKYAGDQGFGVILDTSNPWPQGPVLWAAPVADITKAVVDAYNAQSGVPAPDKANASQCNALNGNAVLIDDEMPSGPGHCAGEAAFWFTNTSAQTIDCAIVFHKNGRFDPASVITFSLSPGQKSGGSGKISTCGADSGQMQYQCFAHAGGAGANSCTAQIQWKE